MLKKELRGSSFDVKGLNSKLGFIVLFCDNH